MQLLWPVLLLLAIAATLSETTSKSRSLQETSNDASSEATTVGGGETNSSSLEAAATEGGETDTGGGELEGGEAEGESEGGESEGGESEGAESEGGEAETEGGEAEAEEGGEEEGAEEEEEKPDPASVSGALVLGACIAIGMILLGLVNARSSGIRGNTWQLLNQVTTVFLAVLYYSAFDAIFDAASGAEESENSDEVGRVVAAAIQSTIWVLIVLFFNVFSGKRGWHKWNPYEGANQVFSHICSFASKTFLNALMHLHPFDDSAGMTTLAVVILLVINVAVGAPMRLIVSKVAPTYAESVNEKLRDMQADIISVSTGFGIVQIIRFAYYKTLPSAELLEAKVDHTTEFSVAFALLAVAAFVIGVVVMIVQKRLKLSSETANMHIDSLKMTCVLMSSWIWVFWGDLQLVPLANSKFLGLVLMSTAYSVLAVLVAIATDMLKQAPSFHDLLIQGSSWVVALSWEETFDVASEVVAEDVKVSPWIIRGIISISMAAVILPSWLRYILPHSLEAGEQPDEKQSGDGEVGAEEGSKATEDPETVKNINPERPTEAAAKDQTTINELEAKVLELHQQVKEKDDTIKSLEATQVTRV